MKILWAVLVKFPPLCAYLQEEAPAHCGWLYASAKALLANDRHVQLAVALPVDRKTPFAHYHLEGIDYYLIPTKNIAVCSATMLRHCQQVLDDFRPDLIHLQGTEFSLASAFCKVNGKQRRIIANIQGLAGPIARYVDGGLSFADRCCNITPLDFLRNTFLLSAKHLMEKRGRNEAYVLRHITDIIGRTTWDKSHVLAVNPDLHYHFLNETLRDAFYEAPRWDSATCRRHTLFVSNSCPAFKGAHQVVKALPLVLRHCPDTQVYFVGLNVLSNHWRDVLRFQGYHLYLRKLIKRLKVTDHVHFLGGLSEEEMKRAYLSAQVYVLPSAIENSSNSLCEAQLLGVPVVASYCGGTPDLVEQGGTGLLYRFEEHEVLAHHILQLFASPVLDRLSEAEVRVATERHDRAHNAAALWTIYQKIFNQ